MLDWQTFIAIGAFAVAGITLLAKLLDKSLSIREHDEFRKGIERTTDGMKDEYLSLIRELQGQTRREIDKLENRLTFMDQTKPSVGQLQDTSTGLKEQISEIKNRINKQSP